MKENAMKKNIPIHFSHGITQTKFLSLIDFYQKWVGFIAQILPWSAEFTEKTVILHTEKENVQIIITTINMKRFLMMLVMSLAIMTTAFAQADKVCGTYKVLRNGVNSKVKVFKHGNGFRAQVIWVDNLKKEDGSIRLDEKNPDKSKRNVQADKIVLIDNVTYDAKSNTWKGGQIYDPTSGKTFKVELYFKDAKTLTVKGMLGPFFERMYWTKIQ